MRYSDLLGFDRETAYQLWFIALFALNYISCAWVLRKLSVNSIGAAAGAYVFTFSLPIIVQLGHSQLLPRFMVPLAFYHALGYLRQPRVRALVLLCLSVLVQFYCTIYIGYFLVLGLLSLGIAYIVYYRREIDFRDMLWGNTGRIALIRSSVVAGSLVLLLPLMLPYYKTSLEYGVRAWDEIVPMIPRIQSYVLPPHGSLLWNWLIPRTQTLPMAWEHQIFMGAIPLLAILAMPIVYRRYRSEPLMQTGIVAFLTFAIVFFMTLYFGDTLYRSILWIPGLRSIRAVARVVLMNLFPAALVIGVLITKITSSHFVLRRSAFSLAFGLVMLGAVAADQYVKPEGYYLTSKAVAQSRSRQVEAAVKVKDPAANLFVYVSSMADDSRITQMDAMMAAQSLNIPTVNGFSGSGPRNYYFIGNLDFCGNYLMWKNYAQQKYAGPNGRDALFANLTFIGHEPCPDLPYGYTFMTEPLPIGGYSKKLSVAPPTVVAAKGSTFMVTVSAKNTSIAIWRSMIDTAGKYRIQLSYRWLGADKTPKGDFDSRFILSHDTAPGEQALFLVQVDAPSVPGTYYLEFDLVQEFVAWFHDQGSPTSFLKVVVLDH